MKPGTVIASSVDNVTTAASSGAFKSLADVQVQLIPSFLGLNDLLVVTSTCKNLLGFLKVLIVSGYLHLLITEGQRYWA